MPLSRQTRDPPTLTVAASITFGDSSDAGDGIFINNGGPAGSFGGVTVFNDTTTADNAVLIANSGAGSGGGIGFSGDSTGGTCSIQLFGNGSLDLSSHNPPGLTIGSLEGDGVVFLANNLTIHNDQDAVFSGIDSERGHDWLTYERGQRNSYPIRS